METLISATKALLEDADATGCEDCAVVSESRLDALHQAYARALESRPTKSLTRLYVGHKNCEGALLTPDRIGQALAQACLTLSGEFGGCSTFDAQGHYVLRGGRLITEQTTILEVAHDDSIDATLTLTSTAKYLAEALDQECVLLASTPLTTFDFVKA